MANTIHSLAIYYNENRNTYSGELVIRKYEPNTKTGAPKRGTRAWKEARKRLN